MAIESLIVIGLQRLSCSRFLFMRTNIDRETQWKAVKGMRRSDEMEKIKCHGEPCPVSDEGVLRDGTRPITQEYKGHKYKSWMRGAFCDQCGEVVLAHDATEEAAWLEFRDQVDRQVAGQRT